MSKGTNSAIAGKKIVYNQYIYIPIPGNNGAQTKNQFYFPDDQNIRDTQLKTLSVYSENEVPVVPENNIKVITPDFLRHCFITLESYSGVQFVQKMPLIEFQTIGASSNWQFQTNNFIGQYCNWPKCYIEVADAQTTTAVDDRILLINVGFELANIETMKQNLGTRFSKAK